MVPNGAAAIPIGLQLSQGFFAWAKPKVIPDDGLLDTHEDTFSIWFMDSQGDFRSGRHVVFKMQVGGYLNLNNTPIFKKYSADEIEDMVEYVGKKVNKNDLNLGA